MKLSRQLGKASVVPILLVCLVSISVLGCKKADPPVQEVPETPAVETPETPTSETPASTPEKTTTEKPAPEKPVTPPPKTSASNLKPDEALKVMMAGISKGDMAAVWNSLPGSYQKDVNEVVQLFSQEMDAEVWNGSTEAFKNFTSVLKAKKELILDPANLQAVQMEKVEADVVFDHLIGILEGVSSCELADLEKLKKFDGATSLKIDRVVFKHFESLFNMGLKKDGKKSQFADFADSKVTVVSSDDKTATLKIETPDEKVKEKNFIKVEGKWVHEDFSPEKWKKSMDETRAKLAKLGPEIQANKAGVLKAYTAFGDFLGRVEKAETKDQLQAEVMGYVFPLLPFIMQATEGVLHGKEEKQFKEVDPNGTSPLFDPAGKEGAAKGEPAPAKGEPAPAKE